MLLHPKVRCVREAGRIPVASGWSKLYLKLRCVRSAGSSPCSNGRSILSNHMRLTMSRRFLGHPRTSGPHIFRPIRIGSTRPYSVRLDPFSRPISSSVMKSVTTLNVSGSDMSLPLPRAKRRAMYSTFSLLRRLSWWRHCLQFFSRIHSCRSLLLSLLSSFAIVSLLTLHYLCKQSLSTASTDIYLFHI